MYSGTSLLCLLYVLDNIPVLVINLLCCNSYYVFYVVYWTVHVSALILQEIFVRNMFEILFMIPEAN